MKDKIGISITFGKRFEKKLNEKYMDTPLPSKT